MTAIIRGGPGSGHFGHEGREGEVGGSLPSGEQTDAYDPLGENQWGELWHDPKIRGEMQQRIVDFLSEIEQETGYRLEDVIFTSDAFEFASFVASVDTKDKLNAGWSEEDIAEVYSKATEDSVMNFASRKFDNARMIWINARSNFFPGPSGWEFDFYLLHEVGHEIQYKLDLRDHPFGLFPPESYTERVLGYNDRKKDDEYRSDLFASHFAGPYPDTGERSWGSRSATDDEFGFPRLDPPIPMTDKEQETAQDFIDLVRRYAAQEVIGVERAEDRPDDEPFIIKGPPGGLKEGINQSPEGTDAQVIDAAYLDEIAEQLGMIQRGGKGSGHHGHEGRPGEVGGSQPSGEVAVADVDLALNRISEGWDVEDENTIITGMVPEDTREWVNDMAKKFASRIGVLPSGITFVLSDEEAFMELIYSGELVRQGFRDENPDASEEEIDEIIEAQKKQSAQLISNARGVFVGTNSGASTDAIHFDIEAMESSSFMTSDYPQFGPHEGEPLYGSEARRTAVHEISHWIDEATGGKGEHDDQFLDEIPEAELIALQRTSPEYGIASEYRADLLSAYILSYDPANPVYGRRHHFTDVSPESMKHLEILLERIQGGMETKSYIFRSFANSAFVLIDGDEEGFAEAILVPEDRLTDEDRERFNVVSLISRGGPGSGHHGHKGRPGKRGGSQPGPGQKVSDLIHVPATPRWIEQREAIEAVESVHSIADWVRKLPLKESKARLTSGTYRYQTIGGGDEPLDMMVVLGQQFNRGTVTMVHEIGHWLDHVMLGDTNTFATDKDFSSPFRKWLAAIAATDTMDNIQNFGVQSVDFTWLGRDFRRRYSLQFVRNLRNTTEIFARSYAQYIALRSGNESLNRGIRIQQEHRRLGAAPVVWEWDEFEPVAEAFDEIFREGGWLNE